MQNLHGIDARYNTLLDDAVRQALRPEVQDTFARWQDWRLNVPRYQQEYVARWLNDPLTERTTFDYETVDLRAVFHRLDRDIDRLRWGNLNLGDFALRVSYVESRAIAYSGYFREGDVLRYRGVRLFVDG